MPARLPLVAAAILAALAATGLARAGYSYGRRQTFPASPGPWKAMPPWQKAPDGEGEFLLLPSTRGELFEWNGRTFLATADGVLAREPGGWQIVPQMFHRHVVPIRVRDGLVWVRQGWPSDRRVPAPVEVSALDPKDWSVRRRLSLPPDANPVDVDEEGCWYLHGNASGRFGPTGWPAISCRGFDGRDRFGFDAATRPPPPPAEQKPDAAARIYFHAIDPDAVWLTVIDFHVAPSDRPIYGRRQFVRLDRGGAKPAFFDAAIDRGTPVLDTPRALFWIASDPREGQRRTQVHRLDKVTRKMSLVGQLNVAGARRFAVRDGCLWVHSDTMQAFSLEDLSGVPSEKVPHGPPIAWTAPDKLGLRPSESLAVEPDRLWTSFGWGLVEIRDDGVVTLRDMSPWYDPERGFRSSVARGGVLYTNSSRYVLRVQADSDQVTMLQGPHNNNCDAIRLGDGVVWSFLDRHLRVLGEDLTPQREVVLEYGVDGNRSMAWKTSCFFFRPDSLAFYRCDAATGQITELPSWRTYTAAWFKKTHGLAQVPLMDHRFLAYPLCSITDAAGRPALIRFRPHNPTSRPLARPPLMLWTYDPAADSWRDDLLPASYEWIQSDQSLLYDPAARRFLLPSAGRWIPLPPLPRSWPEPTIPYWWPVHVTTRYLYCRTPLGLWRTAR